MKRWIVLTAACMALCLIGLGVCVFAEKSAPDDGRRREEFGIYATYVAGEREDYTAPVENKKSELVLPDGTVIAADGVPGRAILMIVDPITEEADAQAWKWMLGCLSDKGSRPAFYEIYFLDGAGSYMSAENVSVTVTTPEAMGNPLVFSLGTDSVIKELPAQSADRAVSFVTDGRRYYILAEKSAEKPDETETDSETEKPSETETDSETEEPSETETDNGTEEPSETETGSGTKDTDKPETSGTDSRTSPKETPPTGDETNTALWYSCLVLAGLTVLLRKKKQI